MSSKTINIIGAGPGGLATAILLAKSGARVRVFERHQRVGGRTSAIESKGFRFDVGPTFFMYPQVLEEIFRAAGRNLQNEVDLIRLDPHYRLVFEEGGELEATPNVERLKAQVAKISPRDAENVEAFLRDNRRKLKTFTPILQTPMNSALDLARPQFLKSIPLVRPFASLDTDLGKFFEDPRIRLAFSFQSKYLGMSPFKCPSLFSILSFLEYEHGIFHPRGGCAALTEAMARVAQEMGVEIRLGDEVEGIDFVGRRAEAVRTRSGSHKADAMVINADFAAAMKRLVPNNLRRRWSDQKIAKKKFSCSTFMLYLGIDGKYDGPHHSIFIARDYEKKLADIEERHVLSDNPSAYVQNACVTDPSLAPKGMSTLYVLVPVTHQHENTTWTPEVCERYRKIALQQVEKMGFADVESRIRYEKMVTPDDWASDHQIHMGATFNLAHNLGQMLHLRPRNRFEDLESVYLTGGGTHPGSGLPVIFESARMTSRLLLTDLGLETNWEEARGIAEEMQPLGAPAPLEVA